jgi:UDP-2-acetamido-3-amino-2,3-dideoxy-glucuronate N-acetyltransferase
MGLQYHTSCVVSDKATIGQHVTMGQNCTVWHGATLCDGVVLGDHVVIGSHVWVGRETHIGDFTRIQHGSFIPARTRLGHSVFVGPNVTMTDDKYPQVNTSYDPQPPIIGDRASIGAGAVILPGVDIGEGSMIGAGAVVTQDTQAALIYKGVPARPSV